MKQSVYIISENKPVAPEVFRLVLTGDTSAMTASGQFVDLRLDGFFLRRPISVSDWDDRSLTLYYKCVGKGTARLAELSAGTELDVLSGLGNGFDLSVSGDRPLLAGGGIGTAPLARLAKELAAAGARPMAVLGFNRREDILLENELRALGADVFLATADGSAGVRGFVTDAVPLAGAYTYVYACGPTPMLRALDAAVTGPGQYSFEERMGCGFGACMGCTVQTASGPKRVCRDGPVFRREEVRW